MIGYCRISENVWKFVTNFTNEHKARTEEMSYLDWQVMQWYKSVPDQLKLPHPEAISKSPLNYPNRGTWRLKALLYLRANLMRILIHRPILLSPVHISQNPTEASMVVDIAKENIRIITHLNQWSDIYKLQQVAFNWFLISALAVLFLAAARAPAQFSSSCKDEFCMVLELIEGFSVKSYVSQQLWKSINGLRKLAPQMGLWNQPASQEPFPSGQDREERVIAQGASSAPVMLDEFQVNGMQMSRELMDWYEAMGEPVMSAAGQNSFHVQQWQSADNFMFGSGTELASVFKDCS